MEELYTEAYLTKLKRLGADKSIEYQSNTPYPNIYFDDFLPPAVTQAVLRDFPEPKQLAWTEFADKDQAKLAFDVVEKLPCSIREVLYFLNSKPMVEFLETLTGIAGIIPDPYYVGGGLHQIKRGGYLEVHADFNRHSKLKLDRRLNLLLYLNQDWREEYGGHFELWNTDMSGAARKVLPLFNRCAIFSTTSTSYHGHPTPLACPPGRTRKSIATYYYSNGRPEEEVTDGHSTLFQTRKDAPGSLRIGAVKKAIRAITPPLVMDALSRSRRP
jgi:hypothetical protein